MKREIICPDCAMARRRLFKSDEPWPGEFVKFVVGLSIGSAVCDNCNAPIGVNCTCVAYSNWTTRIPYRAWETGYITPTEAFDPVAAADKEVEFVINKLINRKGD